MYFGLLSKKEDSINITKKLYNKCRQTFFLKMKKSEYLNIGVLYEQESILLEVLMKKTTFTIIHRYNFHAESSICGHIQYILLII